MVLNSTNGMAQEKYEEDATCSAGFSRPGTCGRSGFRQESKSDVVL
jgi:hypothetical protein